MLGTSFGVGIAVLLLFFAAHILLNLWLTSSVMGVAQDAAMDLAMATDPTDPATEHRVLGRASAALGAYGARVQLEVEHPEEGVVAVRVRAPELRLLPAPFADLVDLGALDRRVVVAREDR